MISKRGVTLDAVYFHAPPYTSERAKQKVVDLAKYVAAYAGPMRLHVINFTDIQLYIYDKCPHDADCGNDCKGVRLSWACNGRKHWTGCLPDHAGVSGNK